MNIQVDDLTDGKVASLLATHLAQMHKFSPAGSIHALDNKKLQSPDLTFWSARLNGELMGCGALKQLNALSAELKSMKTSHLHLRKGVAEALLAEIILVARERGYQSIYLETGRHEAFLPAVSLYQKYGFEECGPFADYQADPHSRFFVKYLE